jgi:hypothetical protein
LSHGYSQWSHGGSPWNREGSVWQELGLSLAVNRKKPEPEPQFVISAPAPGGNLILAPRLHSTEGYKSSILTPHGLPSLHFQTSKLFNFDFNPGPAFHSNADPGPASKINADPDPPPAYNSYHQPVDFFFLSFLFKVKPMIYGHNLVILSTCGFCPLGTGGRPSWTWTAPSPSPYRLCRVQTFQLFFICKVKIYNMCEGNATDKLMTDQQVIPVHTYI